MMLIKKAISADEAKILSDGIYASTTSSPYSTAAGYYNTDNMSVFSEGTTNSISFFSSVEDYIYPDYIQSFLLGHGVVNAVKVASGEEPDTEVVLRIEEITDQETISFVKQYFAVIKETLAAATREFFSVDPDFF